MDNQRKKIILDEIEYWKDHQLLPAQYCDFLHALYTQGEEAEAVPRRRKRRFPNGRALLKNGALIIGALLLLFLSLQAVSLYAPASPAVLLAVLYGHAAVWFFAGRKWRAVYLTLSGGAAAVLITGFVIYRYFFS